MFANRLLRSHLKRRCRAFGQLSALKNDVLDKIVYNSVLQNKKVTKYWNNKHEKYQQQKLIEIKREIEPVSLHYLDGYVDRDTVDVPDTEATQKSQDDAPHILPYSIVNPVTAVKGGENVVDCGSNEINYDCKWYDGIIILS